MAQGRAFIDRGIADRSGGSRGATAATATRRLAAILAADVAGYSRLMGADEEGTLNRLKAHRRELVDPKIRGHNGRIVKTTGDGMLVEFSSVVDAVRCAVEIQRAMVDRNAGIAEDKRITFRIGANLGDVIVDGDDIYGDGVNIAARLEALAEPGGICISRTVRDRWRSRTTAPWRQKMRAATSREARIASARTSRRRSPGRTCRMAPRALPSCCSIPKVVPRPVSRIWWFMGFPST